MALTEAQLRAEYDAWYPGRDWNGDCQAVVVNAAAFTGGLVRLYGTATLAYQASTIVSTNPALAPVGAVHYWEIPDPDGHTALELGGGGSRILHGAPSALIDAFWGTSLGTTSISALTARRPGWKYRGWSYTNGGNRIYLTGTSTAGGGTTPFAPDLTEEDDIMSIRVIAHITDEGSTEEVALVSPFFPDGFLIAKGSTETAAGWLRTYSPTLNGVPHAKLNRDQYLGAITAAKTTRAGYVRGLPAAVTIPPIEIPPIDVGDLTVAPDPEVTRLLGELLAAVAAPRTTTVG